MQLVAAQWLSPEETGQIDSTAHSNSYGTLDSGNRQNDQVSQEARFIGDDRDAPKLSETAPLLSPTDEPKEMSGFRSTIYLFSIARMTVAFFGTTAAMSVCTAFKTIRARLYLPSILSYMLKSSNIKISFFRLSHYS